MARINDFGMPFTSVAGDRSYTSTDWREYFRMLAESGVVGDIGNELQVKPQGSPNKTVFVESGAIMINGVIRILESTTNLSFTDNTSGSTRIDRVVARLNVTDRKIELAVVQGTPGAGAPALTRTATVHEMSLAHVTLANGYSTIGAEQITDEREDVAACGFFRYRAKPAWYPENGTPPRDAWMYTNFKEELTSEEISAIEANPTLMGIISTSGIERLSARFGNIQVFETNGTFNLPGGVERIFVEVIGGGGAGAGMSIIGKGEGGGAGGYSVKIIEAALISGPVTVTIGSGGTGGSGTGGNGGTSSFGSFCSATGGLAGAGVSESSGAGGEGVGGDLNVAGGPGSEGSGGSSFYGGGANRRTNEGPGRAGRKYGGGGGGALKSNNNQIGGDGAPGVVIVRW